MVADRELLRLSLRSCGEFIASLGAGAAAAGFPGVAHAVHRPDAIGARFDAGRANPFFDGVVVPLDAAPPSDPHDPQLPRSVWTVADAVPGRERVKNEALPAMGVELDHATLLAALARPGRLDDAAHAIEAPTLRVLGEVNEDAYGDSSVFAKAIACAPDDARRQLYGVRGADGRFVSVALTLTYDGNVGIYVVGTLRSHQRQGYGELVLRHVLRTAQAAGVRTATLEASPDGRKLYETYGFRDVGLIGLFQTPEAAQ